MTKKQNKILRRCVLESCKRWGIEPQHYPYVRAVELAQPTYKHSTQAEYDARVNRLRERLTKQLNVLGLGLGNQK